MHESQRQKIINAALDSGEVVVKEGEILFQFGCKSCRYEWIGDGCGSYECPKCRAYDGDQHLSEMVDLPPFRDTFSHLR